LKIIWDKYSDVQEYYIEVENHFSEKIIGVNVKDSTFNLNLLEIFNDEINETDMVIIQVLPNGQENTRRAIYAPKMAINFLDETDSNHFKNKLAKYEKEISQYKDFDLQKLLLAIFFEEHSFIIEAEELYKDACLFGKSSIYTTMYHHFLIRNNIGNSHKKWIKH
jgi:hypothetical protein